MSAKPACDHDHDEPREAVVAVSTPDSQSGANLTYLCVDCLNGGYPLSDLHVEVL